MGNLYLGDIITGKMSTLRLFCGALGIGESFQRSICLEFYSRYTACLNENTVLCDTMAFTGLTTVQQAHNFPSLITKYTQILKVHGTLAYPALA